MKRINLYLDKVSVPDLHCCNIIQLPKGIFRLRSLEVLNLYENFIEVLPEEVLNVSRK